MEQEPKLYKLTKEYQELVKVINQSHDSTLASLIKVIAKDYKVDLDTGGRCLIDSEYLRCYKED